MGTKLQLSRSPIYLRAVRSESTGKWDALDQLEDTPAADERIYAYKLKGEVGRYHLNYGRKGGFWGVIADYAYIENQPADGTMRNDEQWTNWCRNAWELQKLSRQMPDSKP